MHKMFAKAYDREFLRKVGFITFAGIFIALFTVEPSFAQNLDNISKVLENIQKALSGNIAKAIAVIAVVLVGFGWMFGYLDLRKAMYCVLGVAIVFGAPQIVAMLSGGN